MPAIPLHHIRFTTGSIAHIDIKGRWTPSQSSRDACHTTTQYVLLLELLHINIPKADGPPHLKVSNSHNSFTLYTALCAIQLFVLSFGVELLDRSVIHLLFIRSFVCNMKRPSVKQSMKRQVSSNFQIYPGKTDDRPPPHLKLPEHWVNSLLFNVTNESPFEMVN